MEEGKPTKRIVAYTVIVTVLSAVIFVTLIAVIPDQRSNNTAAASDSREVAVLTMGIMFVAGVLGGCLYSFRGLTKHTSANDYSHLYDMSYYLRPISSGISGLMVFFLLLGGALSLNIGSGGSDGASGVSWMTFAGRMPYIAFSMLAGFGSQEFMLKLKDVGESLFAVNKEGKSK